jgi:hypothetical protein
MFFLRSLMEVVVASGIFDDDTVRTVLALITS